MTPAAARKRTFSAAAAMFIVAALAFAPTARAEKNPNDPSIRVRIRVKVLEWYLRDQLDTGFAVRYMRNVNQASNNVGAADLTFPSAAGTDGGLSTFFDRISAGPGSMEIALQALEQGHQLKVLSEPVLTVNAAAKQDAKFSSGQEVPYETLRSAHGTLLSTTEFRQTGITLEIADTDVYVQDDDPTKRFVAMKFKVEVSRPGENVPVSIDQTRAVIEAPQIVARNLDTTLFIPEQSPFIAGIIKSKTKIQSSSGVPFLSEIPVLGWLFRSNSLTDMDTELVFIVTAEILWPDSTGVDEASATSAVVPEATPETTVAEAAPAAAEPPAKETAQTDGGGQ